MITFSFSFSRCVSAQVAHNKVVKNRTGCRKHLGLFLSSLLNSSSLSFIICVVGKKYLPCRRTEKDGIYIRCRAHSRCSRDVWFLRCSEIYKITGAVLDHCSSKYAPWVMYAKIIQGAYLQSQISRSILDLMN